MRAVQRDPLVAPDRARPRLSELKSVGSLGAPTSNWIPGKHGNAEASFEGRTQTGATSGLARHACLALLLISLVASSTAQPDDVTPVTEVRAEFQANCESFRQGDDPFFGTQIVRRLRAMLDRPARDPAVRVGRRARLGVELLRLGETGEAVGLLEEASRLADTLPGTQGEQIRRQLRRDLALAHLRLAEERNCVEHHSAASCIVPLLPEAVHRDPAPASRAADLFAELLETTDDPTLRWLHAVARATAGREPESAPPWRVDKGEAADTESSRWRQVGLSVGLHRRDLAGGAAMDDFDGDGDLDLISSTNDPCGSMTALRNDGPPGNLDSASFVDVTAAWGLDAQWGGLNFVHADADGDGDLDLYVLRGGWWNEYGEVRNSLLRNDLSEGRGFVDVTRAAGLDGPAAPPAPTQSAAFADADGDGDLDLYVGHEATAARPYPSRLYRNVGRNGAMRFEDATFEADTEAGVENLGYAKGVTWGDFDDDGDPDLYVSNLGGPNRLYRNDSSGGALRFVDVAGELGVTEPASSFATWFFDADSDGDLDLFAADYSAPYSTIHASLLGADVSVGPPRLYLNQGGAFEDVSAAWGLVRPALPMGANFGDVDSDGRLDVYLGTGVPDYEALMPNVMLRNTGDGFEDVTYAGGFGHLQKGHGVAFGDLDGDGDEDVFHQLGGQYPGDVYMNALFENPAPSEALHLTLLLRGTRANSHALGARVAVRVGGLDAMRTIHRHVGTGGSFGGNSHALELGLGNVLTIESASVRWPGSGRRTKVSGLQPGVTYVLPEGEADSAGAEPAAPRHGDR